MYVCVDLVQLQRLCRRKCCHGEVDQRARDTVLCSTLTAAVLPMCVNSTRCACFWVGVCRRAKISFCANEKQMVCACFHYCCPGDGMKTAKACFFPSYTVYIWRVCLGPSTPVVTDQSQTLVPDREWWPHHCSLWTSCPSSSGFSICGESVSCKSAHVKAAHSRARWWKLQCWSGDTTAHTHTCELKILHTQSSVLKFLSVETMPMETVSMDTTFITGSK